MASCLKKAKCEAKRERKEEKEKRRALAAPGIFLMHANSLSAESAVAEAEALPGGPPATP